MVAFRFEGSFIFKLDVRALIYVENIDLGRVSAIHPS